MEYVHTTVLLHESIEGCNLHPGDIYVDGTLGSGGHTLLAAEKVGPKGHVIGFDRDHSAIMRSTERLKNVAPKVTFIEDSYRNVAARLDQEGISGINAFMLDLGLSSDQFETSGRGFTFRKDEPLLMTFKDVATLTPEDLTAKEIVNTWDEANIADIIYGYGEERYARRIARVICEAREQKEIETTFELVDLIKQATPRSYHVGRIHPATRTFQALRITVNDEMGALKQGMKDGFDRLKQTGRMAIISFHSIEDRIVKNFFRDLASEGKGALIVKKPLTASEAELIHNPRARSAKLRIIEKL